MPKFTGSATFWTFHFRFRCPPDSSRFMTFFAGKMSGSVTREAHHVSRSVAFPTLDIAFPFAVVAVATQSVAVCSVVRSSAPENGFDWKGVLPDGNRLGKLDQDAHRQLLVRSHVDELHGIRSGECRQLSRDAVRRMEYPEISRKWGILLGRVLDEFYVRPSARNASHADAHHSGERILRQDFRRTVSDAEPGQESSFVRRPGRSGEDPIGSADFRLSKSGSPEKPRRRFQPAVQPTRYVAAFFRKDTTCSENGNELFPEPLDGA